MLLLGTGSDGRVKVKGPANQCTAFVEMCVNYIVCMSFIAVVVARISPPPPPHGDREVRKSSQGRKWGHFGRTRCGVAGVKEHVMSRDRMMDENVTRCVMSNKALNNKSQQAPL